MLQQQIHHQVDVVEQDKGSPDMTFDKDIQELKEDEEVRIRSDLRESTIPIDHEVRVWNWLPN